MIKEFGMYVNHLDKFLKVVFSNTEVWQWPTSWSELDKLKFVDEALEYLEKQEMYEECKKLYELKKTI